MTRRTKPYKGEILVGFEEKSLFQSVYPSNNLANSHKEEYS